MQGSSDIFPLLVPDDDDQYGREHLRDDFLDGLAVAYSLGSPPGERLMTWDDAHRLGLTRRALHRLAADRLSAALGRVRLHGRPPALMLSFDGLESSVLLAADYWERLDGSVPGELVVGVPARDVVIITGSESQSGMERARRAVDRVFFAGDQHLLSRDLLVWRDGAWEILLPPVPGPRTREPIAPPH